MLMRVCRASRGLMLPLALGTDMLVAASWELAVPIIPGIADPVKPLLSCHPGLSFSSSAELLAPVIAPLPQPKPCCWAPTT